MAFQEGGAPEAPSNALPNQHFSMPLSISHDSTQNDGSEEWEYEYSATDTDIYYLTLDLTTPSIPCSRPRVQRTGRGGHRPIWINPGRRRQRRHLELAPTISLPNVGDKVSRSRQMSTPAAFADGEILGEDAPYDEDNEEEQEQQELLQNSKKENTGTVNLQDPQAAQEPERLQILDLHTENPIITYKAHTFSCSWAENIGTELLFTIHDSTKPLPVLRSLSDNVDLLAASSARLVSKSIKLVPKTPARFAKYGVRNQESLGPRTGGITIPIGRGTSESRREQARFLERLMEIKHQKGEEDAVTVVAQRRLYPAGWRVIVKEKRVEERAQLQSLIQKGGDEAQKAAERLDEMDREDGVIAEEERLKKEMGELRKSKAGRKPKESDGQGPAKRLKGIPLLRRPRGGRGKLKLVQDDTHNSLPALEQENGEQRVLSTPTPGRWDDLDDPEFEPDDEDMDYI